MEPTADELTAMKTLKDVYDWAGVDDPLAAAVHEAVGEIKLIRELAGMDYKEMKEGLEQATFASQAQSATPVAPTPLKPVHKTRYNLARTAARLRCGLPTDKDSEQSLAPPQQAPAAAVGPVANSLGDPANTGIELGTIWDQASRAVVKALPQGEITKMYESYVKKRGSLPHPDSECTELQIAAMKLVLSSGRSPAADFAVFGPHGNRLLRKQHFMAHFIDAAGRYSKRELPGPPDFNTWWACYKPYRTGLLMLDVAETEHIDNYGEFIKELDATYQGRMWFLVAMADFRMRSEHFERMRRTLELKNAELAIANQSVADALAAYDPARPWAEIFKLAPYESNFWDREVRDKATSFLNSGAVPKAMQAAAVEDGTAQPHLRPEGAFPGGPSPHGGDSWPTKPGKVGKRSKAQLKRQADACTAFNSQAGCSNSSCQSPHVCTYCGLKNHGEHECRTKLKKTKGKGKGKKGGKGGKW